MISEKADKLSIVTPKNIQYTLVEEKTNRQNRLSKTMSAGPINFHFIDPDIVLVQSFELKKHFFPIFGLGEQLVKYSKL